MNPEIPATFTERTLIANRTAVAIVRALVNEDDDALTALLTPYDTDNLSMIVGGLASLVLLFAKEMYKAPKELNAALLHIQQFINNAEIRHVPET